MQNLQHVSGYFHDCDNNSNIRFCMMIYPHLSRSLWSVIHFEGKLHTTASTDGIYHRRQMVGIFAKVLEIKFSLYNCAFRELVITRYLLFYYLHVGIILFSIYPTLAYSSLNIDFHFDNPPPKSGSINEYFL